MRIGGLASGMDINQIVSDLMRAERMPLDKLKQKKQVLEWQRDDYRAMNTLLLDFRAELTQMKLTSRYRSSATSSTDESKVTATAASSAGQASFSISKVTQLASSERILSGKITKDPDLDQNTKLKSSDNLFKSFQNKGDRVVWSQGSVESKTLGENDRLGSNKYKLNEVLKDDALSSWSVKVNGKAYKVVTSVGSEGLADNEVLVNAQGEIEFKNAIAKDSAIRVDYIAKNRTDTFKLNDQTTSVQLTRGSVHTTGINFKLSGTDLKVTIDAEGNVKYNDGGAELGKLDTVTGKITFSYGFKQYVSSQGQDSNLEITYTQNYTTFSLDTHTSKGEMHENFIVQGNETIASLSTKVNASNVGVSMFYDEFSGQMSLSRTETGKYNEEVVTGEGGAPITDDDGKEIIDDDIKVNGALMEKVFGFEDGKASVTAGVNAKFEINGITTERHTNTFTMDGTTFTLKQTFNATDAPISVNVNRDNNQIFENIKEFVGKYNDLIDKIQKKMNEERFRSYLPLTDDERETLSDKQQEQWEEKAKSGLLRRDPLLSSVLSNMRMNFSQPVMNDEVSSLFNQLSKLGITTSANYLEGGKLEINEAKLKKAIEEDPQSVENFFRGSGGTEAQSGVIHRLYDSVNATMDQLKERAGNSFSVGHQFALGREMKNVDDRINSFENRLKSVEDRYWRQFTAMEKAIQRSNQQMMFLMQQFSM
ncbi:flagellar filament capping protein FliD [Sporosarcina sp. HYO08]|uniref:flagellar filament capping protein FliD n=1 Tax=Sporosarcina sp. HYO08 TaxID=1759557 RepID=UPI0020A5494F|nr:flagellar filament capping protein FliD [Sporosarcina sp. HYO08]